MLDLFFKVPHIGPASKQFTKSLSELVYWEFGWKLRVVYNTFKINRYFQLKIKTPHALCSNVVYQFQCSCDTNLAYVGMTTRLLVLAARDCERLVSAKPHKSAITDHIRACATCREETYTVNSFQILKRCHTEYETKLQEALLIDKLNPKLINQHLFLFRKIFCKINKHTKSSSKMRQKNKLQNNHFWWEVAKRPLTISWEKL